MSLTIFLDRPPNDIFSAGQTVAGQVHLNSDKDISLGLVQVDLAGRGQVTITRRRSGGPNNTTHTDYYRSKGYYFYFAQILYQGRHTHKAGQYSWPFHFTIPESALPGLIQSPHGAGTFFGPGPPYRGTEDDGGGVHFLPSSLDLRNDKQIRYYLKASFVPAEGRMGLFHKGLESVVDIPFVHRNPWGPFLLQDYAYSQECEVKSFALLPPELGRGTSFRDKWRSKFNTSSTPLAKFRVTATFPPGLPRDFQNIIPCTIQIARIPTRQDPKCEFDDSQIRLNKVQVREIELKIDSLTVTRAQGYEDADADRFKLLDVAEGPELAVDHSSSTESKAGKGSVPPMDLGQWGQIRLPYGLPESFSTYNFATIYNVTLKMTFRIAEENVKCRLMDGVPFEVLPMS